MEEEEEEGKRRRRRRSANSSRSNKTTDFLYTSTSYANTVAINSKHSLLNHTYAAIQAKKKKKKKKRDKI
jgi:hypothetical protein